MARKTTIDPGEIRHRIGHALSIVKIASLPATYERAKEIGKQPPHRLLQTRISLPPLIAVGLGAYEMKRIALPVLAFAIGWLVYKTDWREQPKELPAAFKVYMDQLSSRGRRRLEWAPGRGDPSGLPAACRHHRSSENDD